MKMNEVETLLNVSRANIRYYEKEGLLSVDRKENRYRDYTPAHIEILKKILLLRKLGFSIEEIRNLQNGTLTLQEALPNNIKRLEEQIAQASDALDICRKIENETNFDAEKYWELVKHREESGGKFVDFCKDYAAICSSVFDIGWKYTFFYDFKKSRKRHGTLVACCILLALCIVRGLSVKYLWGSGTFCEGFLYPFIIFLSVLVLITPVFLISRKHPKAGGIIGSVLFGAGIIFLLFIAISISLLLLNTVFHFLF